MKENMTTFTIWIESPNPDFSWKSIFWQWRITLGKMYNLVYAQEDSIPMKPVIAATSWISTEIRAIETKTSLKWWRRRTTIPPSVELVMWLKIISEQVTIWWSIISTKSFLFSFSVNEEISASMWYPEDAVTKISKYWGFFQCGQSTNKLSRCPDPPSSEGNPLIYLMK